MRVHLFLSLKEFLHRRPRIDSHFASAFLSKCRNLQVHRISARRRNLPRSSSQTLRLQEASVELARDKLCWTGIGGSVGDVASSNKSQAGMGRSTSLGY
jgi:hypothetical protein